MSTWGGGGGWCHEASGLATLGHGGGLVEMAGPREHHFWVPRGLGALLAMDMENTAGKVAGSKNVFGGSRENKAQLVKNRKLY